ncbi:DUF4153 domain-containing protein, partial [Candidatus Peregrinibacteria bacterium]|nr:DUF4153 domain-containing protein [Candidatus Peregrinibacteria bacterium]
MQLPSISELFDSGAKAVLRFPLAMLIALFWTVAVFNEIHSAGFEQSEDLIVLCIFGFSLSLGVDVFCEAHKFRSIFKWIGRVFALLLLLFFWFTFFENFYDSESIKFLKFFLMESVSLLFLVVAPYLVRGRNDGFWVYALRLFERFAQTFFYFAILFAGIALLLASIDYLFGIDVDEEIYFDAWTFIVGILATVFFMVGMPKSFDGLENDEDRQRGTSLLVNYVLTPLAFLYLIVLYLYIAKILSTWQWPEGDVSVWIIVFSLASVLNYFF